MKTVPKQGTEIPTCMNTFKSQWNKAKNSQHVSTFPSSEGASRDCSKALGQRKKGNSDLVWAGLSIVLHVLCVDSCNPTNSLVISLVDLLHR